MQRKRKCRVGPKTEITLKCRATFVLEDLVLIQIKFEYCCVGLVATFDWICSSSLLEQLNAHSVVYWEALERIQGLALPHTLHYEL